MAVNKSETSQYISSYGAGYIRPDQWLTEKLCALISKKRGGELPEKFWRLPEWSKIFSRQVQMASSLLLMYSAETIAMTLKDKRCYNLRSFGAFKSVKFFSDILEEYQSKTDAQNNDKEIELTTRRTDEIPKKQVKHNKISRLKNIDVETRPVQSG